MPAYVKMKDLTSHYQKPTDCSQGISWPEKCATTAKIFVWFRTVDVDGGALGEFGGCQAYQHFQML